MRIIVWGIGTIFKRYRHKVPEKDIVCFVDNNIEKVSTIYKKDIIPPKQLNDYQYDYIVVFSSKYYDEISYQLVMEMGIDCKKILIWEYYLGNEYYKLLTISNIIDTYCKEANIKKILDIGGVISNKRIFRLKEICNIDLQYDFESTIFTKCYNNVYKIQDKIEKKYDLLLIDDTYQWKFLLKQSAQCAKNIFFIIPFNDINEILSKNDVNLNLVNISGYLFGYIKEDNKKLKIFEATHKKFVPINEPAYMPIHAGGINNMSLGYQKDDTGEHISKWNPQINECTVLYWIWKNTSYEILGLNHYRRFFKSFINNYMLQEQEIEILMNQYDIVVAEQHFSGNDSIEVEIKRTICEEAFTETMETLIGIFNEMGEEEYKAFQYVFQGYAMYPRNMFITSRKILDKYCNWLFPILFKLIQKVNIKEEWDNYSKRVIGFFAERLFTVWLVQQNYKIKELPIILVGDGVPFGK